jgi:hypothetical protein
MMLVIDANVLAAYFKESVLCLPQSLTGAAISIFSHLGAADISFLDSGGHIEHEWRSVVDRDWFDAWLGGELARGAIRIIAPESSRDMQKRLWDAGFPRSRDLWYVRTSKAVLTAYGAVVLISEDVDFYSPPEKSSTSARRRQILMNCIGKVARQLKREGIRVSCVGAYIS